MIFARIWSRIKEALTLELRALRMGESYAKSSILTLPVRLATVIIGKNRVTWMGNSLDYEHRFEPILMHIHQQLAIESLTIVSKSVAQKNRPLRILDIGANCGQFGFATKTIFPDSEIVSLEPNSWIYSRLLDNSTKFQNWITHNVGLSNQQKKDIIHFVKGRSGSASVDITRTKESVFWIRQGSLSSSECFLVGPEEIQRYLPKGWEVIDMVKVDTEGHELKVIEGLVNIRFEFLLIETNAQYQSGKSSERVSILELESKLNEVFGNVYKRIAEFGKKENTTRDYLFQRISLSS